MFFLDKDIDDMQHRKKRSQHVVYTEHYDVQNYIFMHGDLRTGAASAASVDPKILSVALDDAPAWCIHAAGLWREWVALCLCVQEDKINCEANYRVVSRLQKRASEPTDPVRYATLAHDIVRRAVVPLAHFRRRLAATTTKVDRYFSKGLHHRIFKGKWFSTDPGRRD